MSTVLPMTSLSDGKPFQVFAAATENARSPTVWRRVCGTARSADDAERKRCRPGRSATCCMTVSQICRCETLQTPKRYYCQLERYSIWCTKPKQKNEVAYSLLSNSGCKFPSSFAVFLQSIDELLEFIENLGFAISFATCQPWKQIRIYSLHVEGCFFEALAIWAPGTLTNHPFFVIGSLY